MSKREDLHCSTGQVVLNAISTSFLSLFLQRDHYENGVYIKGQNSTQKALVERRLLEEKGKRKYFITTEGAMTLAANYKRSLEFYAF